VARDTRPATGTGSGDHSGAAWRVSKVVPQTPEETQLYVAAEERVKARKAAGKGAASSGGSDGHVCLASLYHSLSSFIL
jgi:hypothetical protein